MKRIRIGTRESKLAVWQAKWVSDRLQEHGIASELVYIKSDGDTDLVTPLYELGVQGIFTRALDIALLQNDIDIAVHSYKDVPVEPAAGLTVTAVPPRGNVLDMLVMKDRTAMANKPLRIATSSIRRKAQWLHHYPGTVMENLRGNINTRLQKLEGSDWSGIILAATGLERLSLNNHPSFILHPLQWMVPAPAQGALAIVCRRDDEEMKQCCAPLHDTASAVCTKIERQFLRQLQGGCSTPISALARLHGNMILFKGNITSPDGTESLDVELQHHFNDAASLAAIAADKILSLGASKFVTA